MILVCIYGLTRSETKRFSLMAPRCRGLLVRWGPACRENPHRLPKCTVWLETRRSRLPQRVHLVPASYLSLPRTVDASICLLVGFSFIDWTIPADDTSTCKAIATECLLRKTRLPSI